MGYHRAGFEVVGVDIKLQLDYPFRFKLRDAMTFSLKGFDVVHASPPCQAYSTATRKRGQHPDLIAVLRERLLETGRPYVIENVVGAPLIDPVHLCGSAFGLMLRRHRLFESNVALEGVACNHGWQEPYLPSPDLRQKTEATVVGVHGNLNYAGDLKRRQEAMGIRWLGNKKLVQAIPPAYTEYLGKQLLALV